MSLSTQRVATKAHGQASGVVGGRMRAFTSATKLCLTTFYQANNEMRGGAGRIASCLNGDPAKLQQPFILACSLSPDTQAQLQTWPSCTLHDGILTISRFKDAFLNSRFSLYYHASALLPEILGLDLM